MRLARAGKGGARRGVRRRLLVEQLEDRLVMDGAGFVHTDPEPDPDSIVGVAGIAAHDDYVNIVSSSGELRIDVLANDPLPTGSGGLTIKSVSATARGAGVTISEDRQRIIYTLPAGTLYFDSFYYIVESEDGKLGKANVTIRQPVDSGYYHPPVYPSDQFKILEDSGETTLHVLSNDGVFSVGEIVAVTAAQVGTVRIADDGRALVYRPNFGQTGHDNFDYTVRLSDGSSAQFGVQVEVVKPYQIEPDGDGYHSPYIRDIGTGPHTFDLLANDHSASTPQTPQIVAVESPDYAGELIISDDGRSVTFVPAAGFIGEFQFKYTVRYGPLAHQTVDGATSVQVRNTFLAVDNWFLAATNSAGVDLDVLANDPTLPRYNGNHYRLPDVDLAVVAWSAGSQGGEVALAEDGRSLRYRPSAGFQGDETFTYTVADSNGHRDSATVTVHVTDPVTVAGLPKFHVPGELRQFLIDQAVERHMHEFGLTQFHHSPIYYSPVANPHFRISDDDGITVSATSTSGAGSGDVSHSQTNTQVAGVDEADIVETDGRYLYTFSHGKLVIADLADLENPALVSYTALTDHFTEMYLQGDRITLLDRGSYGDGGKLTAVVMVLDVSDRSAPRIVERTEIDGQIVDSRAVGDRVYVAVSGMQIPELGYEVLEGEQYQTNETLDEYVARLGNAIIEKSLPVYRTYNGSGVLTYSGVLTDATDIYKPIDSADNSLLSLVTFDAGDELAGPLSSTGIFTDAAAEVFMAGDSMYVFRNHGGDTAIFKFDVMEDGSSQLVATGQVSGWLLNQFSVDEYEGRLRIATTEVVMEAWIGGGFRQQQRFNNVFVLEQHGTQLDVVGRVENLAPTETIKSVRFLGERAYVVTFRVIDPLFAIDLSDPTHPEVRGALKIPGFSDYLHPVGENYVIGIGYDASEITGWVGLPQISLFYVGDLANPTLVDQVTMEGAEWASTEASWDHHAVAYFAEHQVLTIPVSWSESVEVDPDGDGWFDRQYTHHSGVWAFQIDVDGSGGGAIEITGKVKHDGEARRSVRIEDALVTISEDTIKINRLDDPAEQIAELYIGPLPVADTFNLAEDSGANVLDVRANDRPGTTGVAPKIIAVTQPVRQSYYWYGGQTAEPAGTVEISADGLSLIFTPSADFFGTATFTYTAFDELRGEQQATVTIYVENVADDPDAVDDQFEVAPGSVSTFLNVLGNDVNVDHQYGSPIAYLDTIDFVTFGDVAPLRTTLATEMVVDRAASIATDAMLWNPYSYSVNGLTIKQVSAGSHGGTVEIDQFGRGLKYTPAAGFVGVETFTYTVETALGRIDTATVTMYVGVEPPAGVDLEEPDPLQPFAVSPLHLPAAEEAIAAATTSNQTILAGPEEVAVPTVLPTEGEVVQAARSIARQVFFGAAPSASGRLRIGGLEAAFERLGDLGDSRQAANDLACVLLARAVNEVDRPSVDVVFAEIDDEDGDSELDDELMGDLVASYLPGGRFSL